MEELTRFNEAMDQALAETLLRFTDQYPALRTAASRVLRGTQRIRSILDDLLDYVQGGIRVHPTAASMDTLCTRIAHEVEAAFPDSRIALSREGDTHGCWDPQRVAQAVSNLMTNAIKYGKAGAPVTVEVDGTDTDEVVIAVHNEGGRISAEKLETLFQPLVRGEAGDPTGASLGLGLFIVREIATAHGGSVDVEPSDTGTTFRLRLPRTADGTQTSAIGGMRRT